MKTIPSDFLSNILDAHGGLQRWRAFNSISAQVIAGGFLWPMKGFDLGGSPRTITAEFRRQWVHIDPFGDPDWQMTYTPDQIDVVTRAGALILGQINPRETFAGHAWETPWAPAQLAYFNGYAMWTYYNLPFILAEPGFEAVVIPPVIQDGEQLAGLRVLFPKHIHTHCAEQELYFDSSGLLRRQDYLVDVAGRSRAAHLICDYIDVQGLKLATKRRVFIRNRDGSLQLDKVTVSIDLSDFRLS
jgi:hypothetical protein